MVAEHRAQPHPLLLRARAQFELHLQGPSDRREAGRGANSACATCSKARCAKPGNRVRIAGQLSRPETGRASLGRPLSTARSKMFSICKTRWRRAFAGSSSRALQAAETARSASRRQVISARTDLYLRC